MQHTIVTDPLAIGYWLFAICQLPIANWGVPLGGAPGSIVAILLQHMDMIAL